MDSDDDTGIDPEIVAAMGFTGFGAQPAKRRKYNHGTDAVVEGQEEHQTVPSGSGANNTALGVRMRGVGAEAVEQKSTAASTEENAEKGKSRNKGKSKQNAPRGLADYVAWGNTISVPVPAAPEKESVATIAAPTEKAGWATWAPGALSADELHALRRGVKNTRGDTMYFLPSFIEDPWAELKAGTAGG